MGKYKYTYQDWVNGVIMPNDLMPLFDEYKLSLEDLNKIESEQYQAFKDLIELEVIWEVHQILNEYEETFAKGRYLKDTISFFEKSIENFVAEFNDIYISTMKGHDGRQDLSYRDIQYIYAEGPTGFFRSLGTPLYFIVNLELLQWLNWFQSKEKEKTHELNENFYQKASNWALKHRSDELANTDNKAGAVRNKPYSWNNLFKNTKHADKILSLLGEHLSSTGEWITEPKGRHLVALFLELREKGYFKSDRALSNPMMAVAFNVQFKTSLRPENFQAKKSEKAEGYREHFKFIPSYKV